MSSPLVNTKSLFTALLKRLSCDLVMDIGSRDGRQALLFRDVLPHAPVVAFEANPYNFRRMSAQTELRERGIHLMPLAVSNADGQATFHISQADYDAPESDANNLGTSSLLVHPEVKTLAAITVDTVRLETFLQRPEFAGCQRIALWIDVEGAEYFVLEGLGSAISRISLIHVETAREPVRQGQKARREVSQLLRSWDFVELGTNMTPDSIWGDLVWIRRPHLESHQREVTAAVKKAQWNYRLDVDAWAVRLKRCPPLYRLLRWLFVRSV
jgi:FkbM family methyltransferase